MQSSIFDRRKKTMAEALQKSPGIFVRFNLYGHTIKVLSSEMDLTESDIY